MKFILIYSAIVCIIGCAHIAIGMELPAHTTDIIKIAYKDTQYEVDRDAFDQLFKYRKNYEASFGNARNDQCIELPDYYDGETTGDLRKLFEITGLIKGGYSYGPDAKGKYEMYQEYYTSFNQAVYRIADSLLPTTRGWITLASEWLPALSRQIIKAHYTQEKYRDAACQAKYSKAKTTYDSSLSKLIAIYNNIQSASLQDTASSHDQDTLRKLHQKGFTYAHNSKLLDILYQKSYESDLFKDIPHLKESDGPAIAAHLKAIESWEEKCSERKLYVQLIDKQTSVYSIIQKFFSKIQHRLSKDSVIDSKNIQDIYKICIQKKEIFLNENDFQKSTILDAHSLVFGNKEVTTIHDIYWLPWLNESTEYHSRNFNGSIMHTHLPLFMKCGYKTVSFNGTIEKLFPIDVDCLSKGTHIDFSNSGLTTFPIEHIPYGTHITLPSTINVPIKDYVRNNMHEDYIFVYYDNVARLSYIKARPMWRLYELAASIKKTIMSKETWIHVGALALLFYGPIFLFYTLANKCEHAHNVALNNCVAMFSDHVASQSPQMQDAYSFVLNSGSVDNLHTTMGMPADRPIPISLDMFATCKHTIVQFTAPLESTEFAYEFMRGCFHISGIWSVIGSVILFSYLKDMVFSPLYRLFFTKVKPEEHNNYFEITFFPEAKLF